MKIIESIMKRNPCYKANKKITVKGFMLHSVGCSQPSASVFIKNWDKESCDDACVHAFIDGNTGDVYQTLPWNHRGWHAGGSANNTHIGVEMCEPDSITYTGGANFVIKDEAKTKEVVIRTYNSAVDLCAKLCKDYSLNPLETGVVVSHAEGYKRGIASNNADPTHLWARLGLGYTMETFRNDVHNKMRSINDTKNNKSVKYLVQVGAFSNKSGAETRLEEAKKAGFKDAFIKVVE